MWQRGLDQWCQPVQALVDRIQGRAAFRDMLMRFIRERPVLRLAVHQAGVIADERLVYRSKRDYG